MSFLFPWAWAWLLSAGGVVLLYLLRRREREHPVSALFLWEQVSLDRASRLERIWAQCDLLLVLQVVAVALCAAALASPIVRVTRSAGEVGIVIDGSASMAASGRPEEALVLAREAIGDSAGPWSVVVWAAPPRVLVPPTANRDEALALLGAYRPTLGGRPPLGQALALLPGGFSRTVVITDDPLPDAGVEVLTLSPQDNLAIVAFGGREIPDGTGYEALVRVRNNTARYQDVQVALDTGRGTLFSSRLIGPGEEDLVVFQTGLVRTALRAEIRPMDAFPWDNVRYCALEGGSTVRVGWIGDEDRYLWAALQAALPVERTTAPPWDLTVAVRRELPALPAGPALLVAAPSSEAEVAEPVPAGPLRGEDSPLLRHVVPEEFRAGTVYPVQLPSHAVVDLWAGEWPALARWEGEAGRRVLVSLDLGRSNLPLLVDFPILLRNIVTWLLPFRVRPNLVVGEGVALAPGAEVAAAAEPASGVWVPDRPGLYELRRNGRPELLAVNVPVAESLAAQGTAPATTTPVRAVAGLPAWPWFAVGAFLVLAAEWALALRRGG